MTTFMLIHGSWHGAWCWYKIIPFLEAAGHRIIAPDLPGFGIDKTPIPEVAPDTWSEAVCRLLDAETDPVVLVGHSRGGMVISQAAEARPDKVRKLVYLCAFLLSDGQSVLDVLLADSTSLVSANVVLNENEGHATLPEAAVRETLYGDCGDADVALARVLLQPEPLAPVVVPIHVTPENYGRVPRIYIECLQDRAITPAMQKQLYEKMPCESVITMDTSHSPFFSAPELLVSHLSAM